MIPDLTGLQITQQPIAKLKPFAKNPREHPPSQIAMLKASISRFGFVAPLLVTPDFDVIAGHGRLIAAKELGLKHVPVIVLPHLSEAEQRALRVADNAIASKGGWSFELLQEELTFVLDGDFQIGALELGFDQGEIDFQLVSSKPKLVAEAVAPPIRSRPSVTQPGDLVTIGGHKLLCSDSTERSSLTRVIEGQSADVVIADLPWNQKVTGHIGGSGAIKHPEFAMASGEMSKDEFRAFTRKALELQAEFSRPGALVYQFIDWRGVNDMISIGEEIFDALINLCVWVKPNGGLGSLYRSRHELICVFRVKGGRHDNFVNLGKHGRNRSNIWEFAAPSGLGPERANLALHPTCKNVDMIAEAIMDSTRRKAIVLDPFLGSGTTLLAAHRTGRLCRGIEIDPYYVDTAIRRLQAESGLVARFPDGRSFQEIEESREDHGHGEA